MAKPWRDHEGRTRLLRSRELPDEPPDDECGRCGPVGSRSLRICRECREEARDDEDAAIAEWERQNPGRDAVEVSDDGPF